MINNVVLVGRIANDLELRQTQSGDSVLNFTIAAGRGYDENTDFIDCVAWKQTAEFMETYLTKGALIAVEGNLRTSTYENQDGRKVKKTEVNTFRVQALESRKQRENVDEGYQPSVKPSFSQKEESVLEIDDSDLPF